MALGSGVVTLVSAIYGGVDLPKPVTVDVPAVMFTDDPDLHAPGWEVRYLPLVNIGTPMLRSRYVKCLPPVDDDVTLWVDGSLTLHPGYVQRCLAALGNAEWALMPHPWRDCIYDELGVCLGLPKYPPEQMRAQCDRFRSEGHPEHWGLFACTAMTRRHTPRVQALCEAWWWENLHGSWMDQLSLPPLLRTSDVDWQTTMGGWCEWWDRTEHVA